MPRLTKISTKTGDSGVTFLGSRQRVAKDAPRVRAYGTLDELASHIGLALAHGLCDRLKRALPTIQSELLHLGAGLSHVENDEEKRPLPRIEQRHIDRLNELVGELADEVGPLENFLLPGGTVGAAQLHVARTVCRRAERLVVALSHEETIEPTVIPYLNRLSDALFLMARLENREKGVHESLWDTAA